MLLFGGESSEHDVSIMGARNVYAAMDSQRYDVLLVYIDRVGRWWLLENWRDNFAAHGGVQLVAALGNKSFMTIPGEHIVRPDVILPILHGKNGEDGTVQGLATLMHIPIVGCDMTASAVTMDKLITKEIIAQNGIKIAEYVVYRRGEKRPSYASLEAKLGSDMFVKPTRSGSSVGVHHVTAASELGSAIDDALEHSDAVLIEQTIDGREIEVAVLGNPPHHEVSGLGEVVAGEDFYTYDEKYEPTSHAQALTNVELEGKLNEKVQNVARRVYEILGCRGMARVDCFVTDDGRIYLNEVNAIPGFTNISMYPKLWRASGMHYPELIDRLIDLARE